MKNVYFLILILIAENTYAQQTGKRVPNSAKFQQNLTKQITGFIENKGQLTDQDKQPRPDVLYYGANGGLNYYLKNNGISYQLVGNTYAESKNSGKLPKKFKLPQVTGSDIYRVDINWVGANSASAVLPANVLPATFNYYIPQHPGGITGVKNYAGVTYSNIYNNINLQYYFNDAGAFEYDFVVNPGADYTNIKFEINGAAVVQQDNDGGVTIATPLGNIRQGAPVVQQSGKNIDAKWVVNGNTLSYTIGSYDKTQPLVIDPVVLGYATYFGGGGVTGTSCDLDNNGNVYMSGGTNSIINVATTGAYQATVAGTSDAFLAKFNAANTLVWCTYYGGDSIDGANDCAVDANANIYITGQTFSPNGMSTTGAHQLHCYNCSYTNNASDAFVAKFNASGILQWSTYFGGPEFDAALACTADASGNIYIAGNTTSDTDIATQSAYQTTLNPNGEGFIAKFNTSGSLQWATYYGGTGGDNENTQINDCAVDAQGSLFITGVTNDTAGIATAGAYQSTCLITEQKAFLAKFSAAGSRIWATYYGGTSSKDSSSTTKGEGCATDGSGNVYITGWTVADSGIASSNAYIASPVGNADAILAKFNGAGAFQWGTYFGGVQTEEGTAIASDASGDVCIIGFTNSITGLATYDAYQTSCDSCDTSSESFFDTYVCYFDPTGTLQWATYYGGTRMDVGLSCKLGPNGTVYMAGTTNSLSNIASPGAYLTTCDSCSSYGGAAFLAEFNYYATGVAQTNLPGANIILYPNPTHDEITIKGETPASLKVMNVYGATVLNLGSTDKISLTNLPGGVYFVQLFNDKGIVIKNEKVVKW